MSQPIGPITPINDFSIALLSDSPGQSILCYRNQQWIKVKGVCLELQFRMENDFFLLFLTDNCPYEECLHIYLLHSQKIVDEWEIGSPYTPGILKKPEIVGKNQIQFLFSGLHYMLTVHQEKKLRIFSRLPGARCGFFRRHYLELSISQQATNSL